MEIIHTPVMLNESLEYLNIKPGDRVVDCTIGEGGHSVEILKRIGEKGLLIGIDKDEDALKRAKERLSLIRNNFILIHGTFADLTEILKNLNVKQVNGIIADLGISSLQLYKAERGFSFMKDGPLDMRMNQSTDITASTLVNSLTESELADVIYYYGEEHLARRIAKAIVVYRKKKRIETTSELAHIVESVYKRRGRINPATKTFQALRIAVNNELKDLEKFLKEAPLFLNKGGRIVVISYHSLEDRIVKRAFINNPVLKRVNKKVIIPGRDEVKANPRARSAKMRVAEKL